MEHSESVQCRNRLELGNLLGTWVNVNARADFITCFTLSFDGEVLKLTILSTSGEKIQNHLDVHPVASPGSELATGFYYYQQPSGVIVAANEKNGVLVLQSYRETSRADKNNNRKDRLLSREFYYRRSTLQPGEAPPLTGHTSGNKEHTGAGAATGENFPAKDHFPALPGCWHNTHRHSSWMKAFSIEKTPSEWVLEVSGDCNGVTWPRMLLTPYSFDQQEMGFIAYCDLAGVSGLFCAYSNKGLMVVSVFFAVNNAEPGQWPDKTFCREFYVNQGRPDMAGS
ncbi:hypothetical protein [Thalassomonas haliotis]|uniref:Lipocalin-like domain-containing protein n=1 Tax=Thalassomonas haliotis TaxID=485448 RepID=A0ABY7VKM3_9GAMM|nr:hypothetical protein [Thalassomonas haliotis]WDE14284.1 hypothetical protein H3N35_13195 [Thalassomonas haliotis]